MKSQNFSFGSFKWKASEVEGRWGGGADSGSWDTSDLSATVRARGLGFPRFRELTETPPTPDPGTRHRPRLPPCQAAPRQLPRFRDPRLPPRTARGLVSKGLSGAWTLRGAPCLEPWTRGLPLPGLSRNSSCGHRVTSSRSQASAAPIRATQPRQRPPPLGPSRGRGEARRGEAGSRLADRTLRSRGTRLSETFVRFSTQVGHYLSIKSLWDLDARG